MNIINIIIILIRNDGFAFKLRLNFKEKNVDG